MAVDQRIKAGVFVVTGGNSYKMTWLGRAYSHRSRYKQTEAEYREVQSSYARYLAEVAEKGFEQVIPARQSFLNDPLTFAPYLRGRPVLMINARWDKYIPRESVLDFWEACGQPQIEWFPTGHATLWLWYPAISKRITSFLNSTLSGNSGG